MTHAAADVACALAMFAAALPAHGGQYRGPETPFAPPTSRGGPAATGAGLPVPEAAGWRVWWDFNKDPFLVPVPVVAAPVTGSDDFYLGQRRPEARADTLAPTEADLVDGIVPALGKLLAAERDRDIQSACLVALGKVGRDGPGVELEKVLAAAIARDDQEVRETAVLALGIAGRPKVLPILSSLVRDSAEGRKLSEREQVSDRTRAFAAYGLALLASRHGDLDLKREVHDLLLAVLHDKEIDDLDLRTAAVGGLGVLRFDPEKPGHKRLLWQTVEELLACFERPAEGKEQFVQAHVPVAVARLLGRGSSALHQRCKEQFAEVLAGKTPLAVPSVQSAAIALGMLTLAPEQAADDAPFVRALQSYFERGDNRLARCFCLVALGRIGGDEVRTWLHRAYTRSSKFVERPWAALAIGLQGAARAERGEVDSTSALLLLDDLQAMADRNVQAALAVAVGLCRYQPAVPIVQRLLLEYESDAQLAPYLAVSAGLLGDASAVPTLSDVLERSGRRPVLMQHTAMALARLNDDGATARLLAMLEKGRSVAVLASLAAAIGCVGDRRSIGPLVELIGNPEMPQLGRAFAAAALGGVGDKDRLPWNVPLRIDCNIAAAVDTLTNGATGVLDIL